MELNLNSHQTGLKLAEAGRHMEALPHIQEHLRAVPDDAQALNDAGAILHCLGRSEEAIEYFVNAKALKGDSAEIVWNLVEACLAVGRPQEAMKFFADMERMRILNPDVLNRTANVFLNQDNVADAIEVLHRSLRISPNQEVLKPMIEVIRNKRPKIAFFCGGDGMTFLNEIAEFVKSRFPVRFFEGGNIDGMAELMRWSDISWFEWCTDLAVAGSRLPKTCKNIIRLHRYEAYGQWPDKVNWANVDLLITVGNSFTKEILVNKVPDIKTQTSMVAIPNGVNLDKFKFISRPRGKNIAFLANLRMVKNPAFVLQCMQKLHYIDPEYRLFFAGIFQDLALEQYLRHMVTALELRDVMLFDGWQSDVNSWLADKHYIVSTSIIEGQPMGLSEGMACGLKPVIHNFPGASEIFPPEFLFNIAEEFCEQILSDKYEPETYRGFVVENYSLKNQLNRVNDVLAAFEAEIDSGRYGGAMNCEPPLRPAVSLSPDAVSG